MPITFPITLPATPAPAKIRLYPRAIVSSSVSPFTGAQQMYQHQGQVWQADITLPDMVRADAEPWICAFLQLNGRFGTFRLGDASAKTPRGVATGTPLVNGAVQTGQVLVTDGWTISTTGILKQGDYIQIGDRLHKVMLDVNSDSLGNATLDIWPRLRASPADNAPIITSNTTGLFRRVSNEMPWDISPGIRYGISFSAVEAL